MAEVIFIFLFTILFLIDTHIRLFGIQWLGDGIEDDFVELRSPLWNAQDLILGLGHKCQETLLAKLVVTLRDI